MNNRKIVVLGAGFGRGAALALSRIQAMEQMVTHTPAAPVVRNDHGDTKRLSARQIRKQRKAWNRAQKEK